MGKNMVIDNVMSRCRPYGDGVIVLRETGVTKSGMHSYYDILVPVGGYVICYFGRYYSKEYRLYCEELKYSGMYARLLSSRNSIMVFQLCDTGEVYAFNSREWEWRKLSPEFDVWNTPTYMFLQKEDNCLYREYINYDWENDLISIEVVPFKGIPKYDTSEKKHYFENVAVRENGRIRDKIPILYVKPDYNSNGNLDCYRGLL